MTLSIANGSSDIKLYEVMTLASAGLFVSLLVPRLARVPLSGIPQVTIVTMVNKVEWGFPGQSALAETCVGLRVKCLLSDFDRNYTMLILINFNKTP